MKKWYVIPAIAGALVIGSVAIAVSAANSDRISMNQAKAKAIEVVGGTVKEIELDRKKSGDVYEVEIVSNGVKYELDLDAVTGKVLKQEKDDDRVATNSVKAQPTASVNKSDDDRKTKSTIRNQKLLTEKEATAIAMKQASGTVTEIELDDDDNRYVYEIKIFDGKYEYEFKIDAASGKVLKFEKERNNGNSAAVNSKNFQTTKSVTKSDDDRDGDDDDRDKRSNNTAVTNQKLLTEKEAVAIAMKQASGTLTEIELDEDDNRYVYEIEIFDGTYEYEFEIDAATGKVLEFKKEREDD